MPSRRMSLAGASPRGRYVVGALTGAVLALMISAGAAYATFAVDPTVIGHNEPTYSLAHPNWGDSATQSVTSFDSEARQVESKVQDSANQTGDSAVEKLVKDCAKAGLAGLVIELLSAITNEQSLDLTESAENTIRGCLERYTTPSQINAPQTAATLAAGIAQGASESLGVNQDLNGLADWLWAVDYYYVEY